MADSRVRDRYTPLVFKARFALVTSLIVAGSLLQACTSSSEKPASAASSAASDEAEVIVILKPVGVDGKAREVPASLLEGIPIGITVEGESEPRTFLANEFGTVTFPLLPAGKSEVSIIEEELYDDAFASLDPVSVDVKQGGRTQIELPVQVVGKLLLPIEARASLKDRDGYTFDVAFSFKPDSIGIDGSKDKPGLTSVTYDMFEGEPLAASIENTTEGGRDVSFAETKADPYTPGRIYLLGVWDASQPICKYGSDKPSGQPCGVVLAFADLPENLDASEKVVLDPEGGLPRGAPRVIGIPEDVADAVQESMKEPDRWFLGYTGSDVDRFVGSCGNPAPITEVRLTVVAASRGDCQAVQDVRQVR